MPDVPTSDTQLAVDRARRKYDLAVAEQRRFALEVSQPQSHNRNLTDKASPIGIGIGLRIASIPGAAIAVAGGIYLDAVKQADQQVQAAELQTARIQAFNDLGRAERADAIASGSSFQASKVATANNSDASEGASGISVVTPPMGLRDP